MGTLTGTHGQLNLQLEHQAAHTLIQSRECSKVVAVNTMKQAATLMPKPST